MIVASRRDTSRVTRESTLGLTLVRLLEVRDTQSYYARLFTEKSMKPDEDFTTPGGLVIPAVAMKWAFARSAGAGGQHVNKTSSKATLSVATDLVTGASKSTERMRSALQSQVHSSSQESRSQWRNRQHCLDRVAEILDNAAKQPAPPRRKTKPSRGATERRLESKHRDSKTKASRRAGQKPDRFFES